MIIDEEQRFGVEHKERLKRLRQTVDVLTLTATPIPRTLHMGLLGIRDISNLETPPPDRMAIETRIVRFDPELIRHAILRELNRDGQIYFVHNRVYNIQEHGRPAPADRTRGPHRGGARPDARTTSSNRPCSTSSAASRTSWSRPRSSKAAWTSPTSTPSSSTRPTSTAWPICTSSAAGSAATSTAPTPICCWTASAASRPTAARRLKAIEEFTELGAGFKIAMRDLEIRGAGNILGTEQSGHIATVGYELYCQLLENAVRRLKNQPLRTPLEVNIDLPWPAYLPRDYVTGQRPRMEVYRRLARVRRLERLGDFRQELRDRFGPLPASAEWLLRLAEVRLLAARWQITDVHLEDILDKSAGLKDLVFSYRSSRKIQRLADRAKGRLRIVDGATAYCRLAPAETDSQPLYSFLKKLLRSPTEPV